MTLRNAKQPRDPGLRFYAIDDRGDGTVDVYLNPEITMYPEGDCDARALRVRGVAAYEGLEEDIRARYDAWCDSAEVIEF